MDFLNGFIGNFLGPDIWTVIKAILLLIVAFIVAAIVKKLITLLLEKTPLKKMFAKTGDGGEKIISFIGRLFQVIVFLLFVPGIFGMLGVSGVADPINEFLSVIWRFLPNVLAAVIIVWVGFFVAKIVRDLLETALSKLKLNKLQEVAGIEAEEQNKLSKTVAYIVYVLILVPVIIAALDVLNIEAISEPAKQMLLTIIAFIPNIFVAVLIIIIGMKLAQIAGKVIQSIMGTAGLDAKLNSLIDDEKKRFSISKVAGTVVVVLLDIFFVVQAINVLQLEVLTTIGDAIIGFIPYIFAAALILLGCFIVETIVVRLLKKSGQTALAFVAKVVIYVIGIFMILSELRIAPVIVNSAFVILIAGIGVAIAIAFGTGGREFAGRLLKKLEDKFSKKDSDKKDSQE